jgi:hypothetical protein
VLYQNTADDHIHELELDPLNGNVWKQTDLSVAATGSSGPPPGASASLRPSGYVRGDGVNAVVYQASNGHIIELALIGTTWVWTDLSAAVRPWVQSINFNIHERAVFNGKIFEARQTHTSQLGWEPPNVPALWQIPTPLTLTAWAAQTHYVVGSRVTFNGVTYSAIQEHVSQTDWLPPNTPALWSPI